MPELFDALGETVRDHAAGIEHAGQVLGVSLHRSESGSNAWFDVATAGPSRLFPELVSTEIRINRASGRIRLIILDVDPRSRCISRDDVLKKFGSSLELSPPTAQQPADAPVYYIYRHPWGDLRIGMSQSAHPCVEKIVTEFND